MAPTRIPLSTYRLQFNSGFRFTDARAIVGYLHALGITDCYASSYLAAVPGSPHGYDVADPTRLNPDVGSDDEYWAWVDEMRAHAMGHILDVVPNHMGIAKSANPWWQDLLENGPSSRYARFFDIEWHPVKDELADKVLIPILGDQYGAVLERQELQLVYEQGSFSIRYFDNVLPVAPDTYAMVLRHDLDACVAAHPGEESDELLSIVTASDHLPSRSTRDADQIAVRAREKEVVKRRLSALSDRSPAVRGHIDRAVAAFNGVKDRPRSFDALDRLLNAQSYRLAHWRVASEEINYRRFFDVNQLAALRMEDPEVFEEVHRFAFDLVRRGAATGLRIDHVDGLFTPGDYLRRLQGRLAEPSSRFYIVVEKILARHERLPDWPVYGTTGYEFAATLNNLFVDRRNERAFDEIYRRFVHERSTFDDLAYRAKKQVLHETMSGDINSLGHQLNRFSERNRHFRDFTLYSLISTIKEVIACFPVYRSYVTADDPISEQDRRYIHEAIHCAKRRGSAIVGIEFDFVQRILLKETAVTSEGEAEERARFIGKFQQITSPVAAKGIEDTALYVYNRLISLNEVGSDPTVFGLEPADVHAWMLERAERWPAALSTTSTHDTKRGEDVRARINVLSEIPGAWKTAVAKWRAVNRRFKTDVHGQLTPDANEEYLLYQTLLGTWPFDGAVDDRFRDRISEYIVKAVREAKAHTSWMRPNEEHERGVLQFVDAILDRKRASPFLQAFEPFARRIAELGVYNSLSQLLVKLTAPGVPDFYQGTEVWDLHLVDPDNRRPVDYQARQRLLSTVKGCPDCAGADPAELLERRGDGRIKMYVTARGLAARGQFRAAFDGGTYEPLATSGSRRDSVFAFARRARDNASLVAITCVPRLIASVIPDATVPPIGSAVWGDTAIVLERADGTPWPRLKDALTGAVHEPRPSQHGFELAAAALFDRLPLALLVPCSI